ncbi:MAG TPA: DUF2892 domain-containing protein [Polyangiaceae bacterium]|nr:DUF2892 domain-containing protein [Polyangiaceae bacterium]
MENNLVFGERVLRIFMGMFLLASPMVEPFMYPLNLLGLALIASGAVGYSPLYGLLSFMSARRAAKPKARPGAGNA